MFKKGGLPDDIPEMTIAAAEPVWVPQLLLDAGMVASTSEGRRMIKQGAVSIDGEKVSDMNGTVPPKGELLLKVGKRRFCKVTFA